MALKYGGSEKTDEYLLDVFKRNVLGTWLTDRTSTSRLYEKCGLILLYRAIMREMARACSVDEG
jgi:hypothetical protein